jgi:hypothetical protein
MLFSLGDVYMTPGIQELIEEDPEFAYRLGWYTVRHSRGDWGCVCEDDQKVNDEALLSGARIISAYPIDPKLPCKGYGDNCIWIITEADRSVTTILLCSEY